MRSATATATATTTTQNNSNTTTTRVMTMTMTKQKKRKRRHAKKVTTLLIRILPTTIFVVALMGSIIIGYLAQVNNIQSSMYYSSSSSSSIKRIPHLRIGSYYDIWEEDYHQETNTQFLPNNNGGNNDMTTNTSTTTTTLVLDKWAKHSQILQQQAGIDFVILNWGSGGQEQHNIIKQYMQHPKTIRIVLNIESQILYFKSRINNNHTQSQQQHQPPPGDDNQIDYPNTKKDDDILFIDFQQPCIDIYSKQQQNVVITTFGETYISYIIKIMKDIVMRYRHKYVFVSGDNRPVFVLSDAIKFKNHEPYIDRIRRYFKTRFGSNIQPYFIADMVRVDGTDFDDDKNNNNKNDDIHKRRMASSGINNYFDSITGYNNNNNNNNPVNNDFDPLLLLQKDYDSKLNEYLLRIETDYLRFSNPFHSWWDFLFFVGGDTTTEKRRIPVVPYVNNVPLPAGHYDNDNRNNNDQDNSQQQQQQDHQSQTLLYYDKVWDLAERLLDRNPCFIKSDEWFVFVGGLSRSSSINQRGWQHEQQHHGESKQNRYLQITKERGRSLYPACV